jgi:hypothetical protein
MAENITSSMLDWKGRPTSALWYRCGKEPYTKMWQSVSLRTGERYRLTCSMDGVPAGSFGTVREWDEYPEAWVAEKVQGQACFVLGIPPRARRQQPKLDTVWDATRNAWAQRELLKDATALALQVLQGCRVQCQGKSFYRVPRVAFGRRDGKQDLQWVVPMVQFAYETQPQGRGRRAVSMVAQVCGCVCVCVCVFSGVCVCVCVCACVLMHWSVICSCTGSCSVRLY